MKDLFNHSIPVAPKPGINIAGIPSQSLRSTSNTPVKASQVKVVEDVVEEAVIAPEDIIDEIVEPEDEGLVEDVVEEVVEDDK